MAEEATNREVPEEPNAPDTAGTEYARSEASAAEDLDWGSFFDDEPTAESSEGEKPTGEETEPAEHDEPAPTEPPAEPRGDREPEREPVEPTPQEPPAAETPPTPAAEEPPAPTEPQAPEPAPEPRAEQSAEQRQEARRRALEMLERDYELDEETRNAFNENPAEALPKLAAQVHMRLLDDVYQAMYQTFPQLYQQMQGVDSVKQTFTQAFDSEWPGLKQHRQEVQRSIQLIRAQDPNRQLSEKDLINEAGVMTALRLRLPVDQLRGTQAGSGEQQPAQPAAPAPRPFTPASPGGGRPAPAGGGGNPWAEFVEDI